MRILFLGKNDEKRCASTSWYLKRQLARMVRMHFFGPGYAGFPSFFHFRDRWNVPKIIQSFPAKITPNVILIDHYWRVSSKWRNLDEVEIPKAFIISDPHHEPSRKAEFIRQNRIDLALFIVKHSIKEFKNRIKCSIEWLPWSVDTRVFRDYGFERVHDVTFLGDVTPSYPLRQKIVKMLPKMADISFFTKKHPRDWNLNPEKDLFKENYAKVLAKSRIFIFDSSILNYPVAKYYEGMACNTLVMAPMPHDGEALHFKPGFNFVDVNEDNFLEKIRYYLRYENERKEIAARGCETIRDYHTVVIRARQLIDYLQSISA